MFRPDNASSPLALRLCFSYVHARDLEEGARRLARSWDEYRRERDRATASHADGAATP
jgi:DNA-binding transcriptional MocR family regulator